MTQTTVFIGLSYLSMQLRQENKLFK